MQLPVFRPWIKLICKHWLQHEQGILVYKGLILDCFLAYIRHVALDFLLVGVVKEVCSCYKLEVWLLCRSFWIDLF